MKYDYLLRFCRSYAIELEITKKRSACYARIPFFGIFSRIAQFLEGTKMTRKRVFGSFQSAPLNQ